MTQVLKLSASKRSETGSAAARRMRRQGRVPAVLYGHGQDPVSLDVGVREFADAMQHHVRFVELEFDGTAESAIIREVQFDTFGQHVQHIDFIRAALDEKLEIEVEVVLKGMAIGVTKQNGVLEQLQDRVEGRCSPRNLPENIELDISELEVEASLQVKDLPALPGVEYLDDPEKAICHISVVKVAEEPEGDGEEVAAEPEVVGSADKDKEPAGDDS